LVKFRDDSQEKPIANPAAFEQKRKEISERIQNKRDVSPPVK